jgi:hypothetical protein
MTVLAWDQAGEHVYQVGVDRGVLYLRNGAAAVWNGLTSVEETSTSETKSFYLDGVKYLETVIPGDYSGVLKAYTYPDEFDELNGIVDISSGSDAQPGLVYYDQLPQSFNLSYRTRIGNELNAELGYKIHLLYNLVANPQSITFDTIQESINPIEFSWNLSGTPERPNDRRPTVHVSIDSTRTGLPTLQTVEDILYGTDTDDPRFPPIDELATYFGGLAGLLIIDNGDGTWDAVDEFGGYVSMFPDDSFRIDNADAVYLDAVTYDISSTNVEKEGDEP